MSYEQLSRMTYDERQKYIRQLQDEILQQLGATSTHSPQPVAQPEPVVKAPTKKMRKAIQRFDAMTDGEQVNQLKSLWG